MALVSGGSAGGSGAAKEWRETLRPQAQVLWIEHDARRDDWVQPLAPLEAVVSDGLLMAHVAVRMSVKNRIIIAALRDHLDFDRSEFERFAAAELRRLATESDQTASRVEPIVAALPTADRRSLAEQLGREEQVRRPAVHRALAAALREAAAEPELLESMVRQSEADAAEEFAQAVSAGLSPAGRVPDPDYDARRGRRLRTLIDKDLKALQRDSESKPRSRRDRWASTRSRS